MIDRPVFSGTTVTLFGGSDALDVALGRHVEQRGGRTHVMTVPTGWLRSATHAIVRLDTAAGRAALEQLVEIDEPLSRVIAVAAVSTDQAETDRITDLCRTCGTNHHLCLVWHQALDGNAVDATRTSASGTDLPTDALAAVVADEMVDRALQSTATFVSRTHPDPGGH